MLVFHSHCQLGNQMFIYACAHSLGKERNLNYCLSNISDLKCFNLSKEDHYLNWLKWCIFRLKNLFFKYKFEHLQDNQIDYSNKIKLEKNKDVWYYGYFQGEKYFIDNNNEIRSRFQIKNKHINDFNIIKNKCIGNEEYAIVHVRLKDYKTFGPDYLNGPDLTLPFSYYHNLIKTKIPKDYKIIFLSDEINSIKDEFSYVKNAIFSENSVIIDLKFIINANICILSCSTLSWWGAWLNKNEDKVIYIPKYFLGFKVNKEFPVNMIPSNWQTIAV